MELTISPEILERIQQPTESELQQEEYATSKTSCFSDLSEYPVLAHITELRETVAEVEMELGQLKEQALDEALNALVSQNKQTGMVFDNDTVKITVRMIKPSITAKNVHQYPDLYYHLEMAEVERGKAYDQKRPVITALDDQILEAQKKIAKLEATKRALLEQSEECKHHLEEAAKLIREIQSSKTPQLAIQIKGVK